MKRLLLAFQFMTVLPIPWNLRAEVEDMGRCMAYFPLVGLAIGGLLCGLHYGLIHVVPEGISAFLCVVGWVLVTGGMHLDGLADSADAFLSWRDRTGMLAIMKDSRIGVMGAVALILMLLGKVELLTDLNAGSKGFALLLIPMVARWGIVLQATLLPYARAEGGLGGAFIDQAGAREAILATVFTLSAAFGLMRIAGLLFVLYGGIVALLFSAYVRSRIRGATGDTLGAGIEVGELTGLLFMLVVA
jgi:adenosylcobinamide-GDP ribazoletransferase